MAEFARTQPDLSLKGVKSINIEMTFEQALRFSLAVQSCVLALNRYKRSTVAGREMGLLLSIKTDSNTVAIIEKRVQPPSATDHSLNERVLDFRIRRFRRDLCAETHLNRRCYDRSSRLEDAERHAEERSTRRHGRERRGIAMPFRTQDRPEDADEFYRKAVNIDASSEIAELARVRLSEIARKIFRSKTPGAERMDAVMYLVGAIEKFGRMSKHGRLMSCVLVSVRCRRRLRPPIPGEPIRGEAIPGEPISGYRYGAGCARGAHLLRVQRSRVRASRRAHCPKRKRGMAFFGSIPHGIPIPDSRTARAPLWPPACFAGILPARGKGCQEK